MLSVLSGGVLFAGQARVDELTVRLDQIGRRVEGYYARARSIVCRELVRLQPLRRDLMPEGPPRELVYEMRVSWDPDTADERPTATVFRQLLTVNGQPATPDDEPECTDPRTEAVDPLVTLLPRRRPEFVFTSAGTTRIDGRNAVRLDYRPVSRVRPTVTWNGDCASIDLAGQTRGRVWVDAATDEVLRLDEQIDGQFEFPVLTSRAYGRPNTMVIERVDTTVRYELVTFSEPEETVLLPASIETLTIVRNAAVEWSRKTQVFSEYRRFLGTGRVLP
jgi:hypothetical protein